MDAVKEMILRLTGVGILSAVLLNALPQGAMRKAVGFSCGLVMTAVVLSGAKGLDLRSYRLELSQYSLSARQLEEESEEETLRLMRDSIEAGCEEYILDKGTELGIENLSVSVSAVWSGEGTWVLERAVLSGNWDSIAKYRLQQYILTQFGIGTENQEWRQADGG